MAPATKKLSIELPADLAEMVAAKVAMGDYANESEVIAEGLSHLRGEAERLEHWLQTEVVAAYDEVDREPASVSTIEQVRDFLAERRQARTDRR
jgi:antitoxin ParD1/3/4